jgi:hypothetical protein
MMEATVVTVPPGVINRPDYHGYTICIKPGDVILIRYDVVFAYHDQPDRDTPIYKNLIFEYDEQAGRYEEYWLCDILQVFAVKEYASWRMINGFVMLSIMLDNPIISTFMLIPDSLQGKELKDRATVVAGGTTLGLNSGDMVYINPGMVMRYQLNLESFYIIKEQHVLGKAS